MARGVDTASTRALRLIENHDATRREVVDGELGQRLARRASGKGAPGEIETGAMAGAVEALLLRRKHVAPEVRAQRVERTARGAVVEDVDEAAVELDRFGRLRRSELIDRSRVDPILTGLSRKRREEADGRRRESRHVDERQGEDTQVLELPARDHC